ncbi:hypothetical protein C0991_002755 [Blastosporella zonata]|nr:hypothetical protein C0991_002755 [Blastosporella zonata]
MNQHLDRLDSTITTRELYPVSTISPGSVTHGYSTTVPSNTPVASSKLITLTFATPAPSVWYRPSPPHIALPTVHHIPTSSAMDHSQLTPGPIVGIVFGVLGVVMTIAMAIFCFCYRKRTKFGRPAKAGWQDLEHKGAVAGRKPHYERATVTADILPNYTEYVPRTEGRLSPVSQSIPSTFGRIKEHHTLDPFADPKIPDPYYTNNIEMSLNPSEAGRKL